MIRVRLVRLSLVTVRLRPLSIAPAPSSCQSILCPSPRCLLYFGLYHINYRIYRMYCMYCMRYVRTSYFLLSVLDLDIPNSFGGLAGSARAKPKIRPRIQPRNIPLARVRPSLYYLSKLGTLLCYFYFCFTVFCSPPGCWEPSEYCTHQKPPKPSIAKDIRKKERRKENPPTFNQLSFHRPSSSLRCQLQPVGRNNHHAPPNIVAAVPSRFPFAASLLL
jgi:hypothetical protein